RAATLVADLVRRLRRLAIAPQRPREFAILRMVLARQEWSEESAAGNEFPAASGTSLGLEHRQIVRFTDEGLDVGALYRFREWPVEILEHLPPVDVSVLDLVWFGFQRGGEPDVEHIREALHHHPLDLFAEEGGEKAPLLELGVAAVDERRDDRCVRRRTTDTETLQFLDETRLGVPWRRLGEVLRGGDRLDWNILALLHHWQPLLFLERFPFFGLARFLVETLVPVELDDAASRSEQEPVEIEVDRGRIEDRW